MSVETHRLVINIDGNIGAGKSSFIKRLISTMSGVKIHVIEENVDRDEESRALLQNYYKDPKTHALEFQRWILRDKAEQLAKIEDTSCIIIFDRYVPWKLMYIDPLWQIIMYFVFFNTTWGTLLTSNIRFIAKNMSLLQS
jgi:deoxyadenosine/deoxycytidine kinase